MKRIKSEENHEKTNDVNFQGTVFWKMAKKTSMILEERKRMSMEMSM